MDDSKYELQDFRGTLVNFKDGFHRKISTWTFFAAVSFHPRHVTFSTSVHPFSLNWSFNVIRIPVQLPVKLNTLLWNYPKKEETFHHVNTKSRQIQNFIAPCFFQCAIFFLFSFPERYSTTPWFVHDIRFYASNTSNLLRRKIPRYAIPLSFSPRECCLASKQKKKRISLDFKELFVLKQLERIEQQEWFFARH